MHLIFLVDGMPEGIAKLKKETDFHKFGVGSCRLREIKMFDLQFDSRDKEVIYNEFYINRGPRTFKDKLAYSFFLKETPFKHGRFNKIISWAVRLFLWPFGIKSFDPEKVVKNKKPLQVSKALCNVFPVAVIEDNFIFNKATGQKQEWL